MTQPTLQPGNGTLPKLNLVAADGARAEIYLYGAHLTSWMPAAGDEVLFLSPKADFRPGAAIRGGTPIIFPQFSDLGALPRHGFARVRAWEVAAAEADWACLRLREDESSLGLWPHPFVLEYTVRVGGNSLELALKVSNPGPESFDFTAALHTYLRVGDARQVSIRGLQGLRFSDSANNKHESTQEDALLTFPTEIDRAYYRSAAPVQLIDGRKITNLEQSGFADVVAWNPGPQKCAALKDMQPGGYLQFVCIEAAVIEKPVMLQPGESWLGIQRLTV